MDAPANAQAPPRATPAEDGEPRRRLPRPVAIGLVVALALVALVFSVREVLHAIRYEDTDDAFIEAHVAPVSPRVSGHVLRVFVDDNAFVASGAPLVELDPRDFEARVAQMRANLEAALAREKAGRESVSLTEIRATSGVRQAEADLEVARASVETARAMLEGARSRLGQTAAVVTASEAAREQYVADVKAAEADEARASSNVGRYEHAIGKGSVSREELERVQADAKSTAARLAAARARVAAAEAEVAQALAAKRAAEDALVQAESQLVEARAKVRDAEARLDAARAAPHEVEVERSNAERASAEVAQARAALEEAELALSYTRIAAPQAGHVTRKSVEPGTWVGVGQPLLALVPEETWVVANFKETQLTKMRVGQRVIVHVDAYPHERLEGRVDSIQRGSGARFSLLPPENATGNYVKVVQRVPVKITFTKKPDRRLLLAPGMSVVPDVDVTTHGDEEP